MLASNSCFCSFFTSHPYIQSKYLQNVCQYRDGLVNPLNAKPVITVNQEIFVLKIFHAIIFRVKYFRTRAGHTKIF